MVIKDLEGEVKKPVFLKTKKGFISIVVLVIILIIGGLVFSSYLNSQKKLEAFNSYKEDFTIALSLLEGEAQMNLDVLNETNTTWNDAIFGDEDIDFNTALILLYMGYEEDGILKDIKSGREDIDEQINKLQDEHPQFSSVYLDLLDLYATYTQINDLSLDPSGSLQSFRDQITNLDGDFKQGYSKIKVRIPQELKDK